MSSWNFLGAKRGVTKPSRFTAFYKKAVDCPTPGLKSLTEPLPTRKGFHSSGTLQKGCVAETPSEKSGAPSS